MAIAIGVAFSFACTTPARAQTAPTAPDSAAAGAARELVGQVVKDGAAVPETPVTLHRVTPQESGEIASSVTSADGRFSFQLEPVAGSDFTIYFVTADHLSARYFGRPIHTDEPLDGYTIQVYDTTSVLPEPIRVVSRDIVLIPEASGSWEVNEVVRIGNPGTEALVAGGGMPTWSLEIPERAGQFEVGEGDILPHEVTLMENEVLLLTPVTPGERDLYIRYRLPASPARAEFPLDQPTSAFNLFVLQPAHLTGVEGLASARMVEAEGEQFLQYSGEGFAPGARIAIEWSGGTGLPIDPVVAAVAATLLLLGVGVWGAIRNRPAPTSA